MIAPMLLLAFPIAPQAPKPIETNIAAIRADPKRFDDQVVHLHGWVNQCAAYCLLQERPANSPAGPGQSLSIAADPKFDATIKPLVPTYVELDARVDSSCLGANTACADLTVVLLRGVIDATTPPPED